MGANKTLRAQLPPIGGGELRPLRDREDRCNHIQSYIYIIIMICIVNAVTIQRTFCVPFLAFIPEESFADNIPPYSRYAFLLVSMTCFNDEKIQEKSIRSIVLVAILSKASRSLR